MAHNLFPEALQDVWSMQSNSTETTVDGTMNFKKPVVVSSVSSAGVGVFASVSSAGAGVFASLTSSGNANIQGDISCNGYVKASYFNAFGGVCNTITGYLDVLPSSTVTGINSYATKPYVAGLVVENSTAAAPRGIVVSIPAADASGDSAIFTWLGNTATAGYSHFRCYSYGGTDTDFKLLANGQAYADGSWNAGGADVAEIHRWNPNKRDNTPGTTIVLDETMPGRVRYSTAGDSPANIIGVISKDPGVLMGNSPNDPDKFLKDADGEFLMDENGKRIRDPNYVGPPMVGTPPMTTYKPNSERPAMFAVVGYLGKLNVIKGQVVGDRWKLMRVGVHRDLYLVR
jgi:hypothetical protein